MLFAFTQNIYKMSWEKTWNRLKEVEKEYSRISFTKNQLTKQQQALSKEKGDLEKQLNDLSKNQSPPKA